MDENKEKWKEFALGASPALLIILMSLTSAGGTGFLLSLIYVVVGFVLLFTKSTNRNTTLIGIFTGAFASFIVSAFTCKLG